MIDAQQAETLTINQENPIRTSIPDSEIPVLRVKYERTGKLRPAGISRYQYFTCNFNELKPDHRADKDSCPPHELLTNDKIRKIQDKFRNNMLKNVVEMASDGTISDSNDRMGPKFNLFREIYHTMLDIGLSRFDAEEAFSENKDWLIFCTDPNPNTSGYDEIRKRP